MTISTRSQRRYSLKARSWWIACVLLLLASQNLCHAISSNSSKLLPVHALTSSHLATSTTASSDGLSMVTAPSAGNISGDNQHLSGVVGFRGGGWIPAGYNPFGYKITALGEKFLEFGETCLESDVGRFLASIKTRKTLSAIQSQWLEVVRVSKKGQSMRVYRNLKELIEFCLAANLID